MKACFQKCVFFIWLEAVEHAHEGCVDEVDGRAPSDISEMSLLNLGMGRECGHPECDSTGVNGQN